MKITLEPTPEIYRGPINGVEVPMRIWKGFTEDGIPVEAYVLSITPDNKSDVTKFEDLLPPYMIRSRQAFKIADFEQEKPQ